MKPAYKPLVFILLVIVGMIAVAGISALRKPAPIVPFHTDWSAAQAEAKRTGKPLFAYFTAEWCGPCQQMKHTTWADVTVAEALRDYVPVMVDVDSQKDLARRYVPTPQNLDGGIPAFRVLDQNGNIVKEAVGAMAPDQFLAWLARSERRPRSTDRSAG
jgi:thiol:disulfide interchange protein